MYVYVQISTKNVLFNNFEKIGGYCFQILYTVRLADHSWKDNRLSVLPYIVIDNWLVITEGLVIILPVCLSMTLTVCYTSMHVFGQTSLSSQWRLRWVATKCSISSGYTLFDTHPAILDTRVVNCTCSEFRWNIVRSSGVWILRENTVK